MVEVGGLRACFTARFSAAALLPFGAGSSFAVRAVLCVVERLVPSLAFGFYLLDASSSSLQLWQPKMSQDIAKHLPRGQNCP